MTLFFPDNTVLVNFAHIRQIPVLEVLLQGRGRWVSSVAAECERSADVVQLEDLKDVPGILGAPIRSDPAERVDARAIQVRLREPGDASGKSFGESETIAVIVRRQLDAMFLTDDRGAIDYLAVEHPEIKVFRTTDLLALAVRVGSFSAEEAVAHLAVLRDRRRTRLSDASFRWMLN